jgi:tetratricopeptide (TPR) repeat protein
MKNSLLTIALILCIVVSVFAQESPYQKVMKKEIANLNDADSLNKFQQSANAFARISQLNPNEWQPYYYNALAYIYQGLDNSLSLTKKDEALAKAEELIKKAEAISPNNSEIVTLEGFKIMAEVSADPSSRGQSLSGTVLYTFGKAMKMDPQNPRAALLMGQMEFGMAKFFHSGTEKACGLVKQSQAIYAVQDDEALKAKLAPTWGRPLAEKSVKACQ